jgi:tRNA (guanine26-N2/guanine27-N2)-dimethyltransferase
MKVPPHGSNRLTAFPVRAATKMDLVEHREGGTRLLVPQKSLTRSPPPTAPVFFNPAGSLNRDVSVAIAAATDGVSFCDSMCGVGARGLRIANEVERIEKVTMVDFNAEALEAARQGAALNRVKRKCEFSDSETTSFLSSRFGSKERFDYVDVDPFGSPVRELQGALSAVSDGGIVSVTATDTAVLCGVYPQVSRRRYGAVSLKNHFGHETGLRILAGALVREGAKLDVGVTPTFAHSTRHYLRLFARVASGAREADRSIQQIGHLAWCPSCGNTEAHNLQGKDCPSCGKKVRTAGPLWIGSLTEEGLVERAAGAALELGLPSAAKLLRSLVGVDDFPPWSFSIDSASSSLRVATAPEAGVRRFLEEKGWRVMRTPFEKSGLKTDAPYAEFLMAAEGSVASGDRPGRM